MIFADIPAGESVFIDANVFVYDFGPTLYSDFRAGLCWNVSSKAT